MAREVVADFVRCETEMNASEARLRRAVAAASTSLTDIRCIGVVTAAMFIGHVGLHRRVATAAHFASCNGTARMKRHRVTGARWATDDPSVVGLMRFAHHHYERR